MFGVYHAAVLLYGTLVKLREHPKQGLVSSFFCWVITLVGFVDVTALSLVVGSFQVS